ncbi:hypothetical protein EDD29_0091 [Actinocorallia herbida]|uniref:Uncharacterized protein n=1 Tax=Actinocorallia herbida TaxID=58109 RepID=A0A3N1CMT2_9ACTN|nr:DUF6221 family protein [Actinocorallia herbida]ROO82610.1 hypothetical protein EDD29_0091 [Actinocorallia herbida]
MTHEIEILAYLKDRYAEEERLAHAAGEDEGIDVYILDDDYQHNTIAIPSGRLLADVQARRRVVDEVWTGLEDFAVNIEGSRGDDCGARELRGELLRILASPYAGRLDFRREWLTET